MHHIYIYVCIYIYNIYTVFRAWHHMWTSADGEPQAPMLHECEHLPEMLRSNLSEFSDGKEETMINQVSDFWFPQKITPTLSCFVDLRDFAWFSIFQESWQLLESISDLSLLSITFCSQPAEHELGCYMLLRPRPQPLDYSATRHYSASISPKNSFGFQTCCGMEKSFLFSKDSQRSEDVDMRLSPKNDSSESMSSHWIWSSFDPRCSKLQGKLFLIRKSPGLVVKRSLVAPRPDVKKVCQCIARG